jgi:xanthine dehydrogenase YagT iron-sulfur-binding subunit
MATHKEPPKPGAGVTRRDFLRGGAAGALTTGLLSRGLASGTTQTEIAQAVGVVGPEAIPMAFRINGERYTASLEPRVTLLDALRDHLDLTGAKKVCDRATCGACTVILDRKPVYSCTVLAIEAQGADIVTIEGLGTPDRMHELQAAFVGNDAQQCGFCTPGWVMSCKAFLDAHDHPTPEEIEKGLGGNLCRCGTYAGIRKAIQEVAAKGGSRG